jgi:hypothetical protein
MKREEIIANIAALRKANEDDTIRKSQIRQNLVWIRHYENKLKNEDYE